MKNKYLPIILIVISLIAVFLCLTSFSSNYDIESSDWILGTFSTIITILIGWQVVQYMYQKSTIRIIIDKELRIYEEKTDHLLNKQLFLS